MLGELVPRWEAGSGLGIVWPGGVAVVDESVGLGAAERLWSRLHREPQLGVFLKGLAEGSDSGFLDLPVFAVAVLAEGRCHVAVRGPLIVEVLAQGDRHTLSGEGITTWAEKVVAGVEAVRVAMSAGEEDASGGPVIDGVLPAGGIAVGAWPAADQPGAESASASPASPGSVAMEPEPEPEPRAESTQSPEPGTTLGPEESSPPQPSPYASLWDLSEAVDVEAAAIRPEDTAGATTTQSERPLEPPDGNDGDTVIDEGEVDIKMPGTAEGHQVLARFCDRGHANPPERGTCFVCNSAVTGEARLATRPQLGWLKIGGGETVALKGPIVAGRKPESSALPTAESPRLVALPYQHVSSTHLAFLLEGWSIMVRDLGSRNGTYLRRHGKPPVRLPDSPVPLVTGDLIDLGHGVFIQLDGTP